MKNPFHRVVNGKLGNNINKGQDKVNTPYTLYVQEDFVPLSSFPEVFQKSLELIRERPDFDLIRYYAYYPYTSLKNYKDGFSEMIYKPYSLDTSKVYFYNDHPHLRHSNFLEKFGRYEEGLSVDRTEYRMCISLIQKKAKGLFYNDIKGLFDQLNTASEPSTISRKKLTTGNSLAIKIIRNLYRQVKYNYDILFYRP